MTLLDTMAHAACDGSGCSCPMAGNTIKCAIGANAVRSALAAAEAAGWVLVPKEPTQEMLIPMANQISNVDYTNYESMGCCIAVDDYDCARETYLSALSARPPIDKA